MGRLVRRYKRFLADVDVGYGRIETMHCPNTGAMSGCSAPNSVVWYSRSRNPGRKYAATLELVRTAEGALVGVNTLRANRLVEEALSSDHIGELLGFERRDREVRDERLGARFDFVLSGSSGRCAVEVKSVSLSHEGRGLFPDAPSARALRHLRALESRRLAGDRAVMLFCVQHSLARSVSPADHIDPEYGRTLRRAHAAGVELIAYRADLSAHEFRLTCVLPVVL
jgi:sugar fermentation stimulation protein A